MKTLHRFCLYGFLKNFDFSKPFIILYYLSLGLDYFQIGILISFLNISINLMELPSGAFADIYGRKKAMIISLISYVLSFIVFSFSLSYLPLFLALFLFSIGEAFRTGTHKAIIFDWLKQNNRIKEKTQVYGFTRSWSKIGSALSVLFASIIIISTTEYRWVFIFSIIPYTICIWNIICYPSYLNNKIQDNINVYYIFKHTFQAIKESFTNSNIRKLIIQGVGFEGVFDIFKNFLQPILKAQAIVLAGYYIMSEKTATAYAVGIVYFILHLLSAGAARKSYKFLQYFKSENIALIILIFVGFILTILASIGLYTKYYFITIISFVAFYILQNVWRPILVSEYDNYSETSKQATILSVESQSKTLGISIIAPIAGFIADKYGIHTTLMLGAVILFFLGIFSLRNFKKNPSYEM